jgi:hypothetical protein
MQKTWFVATISISILAIAVCFIFINRRPEDPSQTQTRLNEQENRLIFLEDTLAQMQGEVTALDARLQAHQSRIQRQARQIAQQKQALYQQGQQLKAAEKLVSQQQALINGSQLTQNLWQDRQRFRQTTLQRELGQLQSQYDTLSRSNPTQSVRPQQLTPNQRTTQIEFQTQPSTTPTQLQSSDAGVSRQEYQRHLQQADLQKQQSRQNLNRIERTRQRQDDLMRRARER